jgi:general secretion pathway protein F
MPTFRYRALGADGRPVSGRIEARDPVHAVERLRRDGYLPVAVSPAAEDARALQGASSTAGRGLGGATVAALVRELGTLLAAGQDIDRALRLMADTERHPRVRALLTDVRDRVRAGEPLSAALAAHGTSFSRLCIGLVRAGEAGGRLAAALDDLATLLERQRALNDSVVTALVYPALLVAGTLGAVVFLLLVVVPQFAPIFAQAGAALPRTARLLLAASEGLRRWGPWLPALAAAVALGSVRLLREPALRLRLDRLALRLPVVGPLIAGIETARLTRTLGSLLSSGVELLSALRIARDTLSNRVIAAAVDAAIVSVERGGGLSDPLERANVLPARTVQLLRVGEESARLAEMAQRIADDAGLHTRHRLDRLMALLTPVLMIVLGTMVGGTVVTLLSAVFSVNDLAF